MGVFEPKIIDALRSLAATLQLSMLLPATLLVGSLFWLLTPQIFDTASLLVIALPVLTISYLFNAFNMVILRALEGYIVADSLPLRIMRRHQRKKHLDHHKRIDFYQHQIKQIQKFENDWQDKYELPPDARDKLRQWQAGWDDRIDHEFERLEERFPPSVDRILATELGNIIAAFEFYPEDRYHINTISIWPRFAPTLLEKKYATIIDSEKALLDFFVNLLLVSSLIWIITVPIFALSGRTEAGLIFFLTPPLLYLIYKGSCVAAANWGATMKSAFDLYRFELIKALKLAISEPMNLEQERALWRGVSDFFAFGESEETFSFDYTFLTRSDSDKPKTGEPS